MSGRICVNFPEKDINFILAVQNLGNFNKTSQILYPRKNDNYFCWYQNLRYGAHLAYRYMHVTHFCTDIISNNMPFHLICYLSYTKIKSENNLTF